MTSPGFKTSPSLLHVAHCTILEKQNFLVLITIILFIPVNTGRGGEASCSSGAEQTGCCQMQKPPARVDRQAADGECGPFIAASPN